MLIYGWTLRGQPGHGQCLIAETEDNGHFDNSKQLQKLAGYAIVTNDLGEYNVESWISYNGRKRLRHVLYNAAILLVGKNV